MKEKNKENKSRIFITGDTHCPHDVNKLTSNFFEEGKELTKDDIVIICGDAGFVWNDSKEEQWWINWISEKPWTTIYCDGNHEGHVLLNTYPVTKFHGAKVHKITDSLYHVLRGEVMNLNGKKFFFFGGGFSHDIEYRVENVSWWQEEMPVQSEVDNAIDNLNKVGNKVDYIITHDVPAKINLMLGYNEQSMVAYDSEYVNLSSFLQNIYETVDFKDWFAGHYHIDSKIDKVQILYQCIVKIDENISEKDKDKKEDYSFLNTPFYQLTFIEFTLDKIKEIASKERMYINENLQIGKITLKGRCIVKCDEFFKEYENTLSENEIKIMSQNLKRFYINEMKKYGSISAPVKRLHTFLNN